MTSTNCTPASDIFRIGRLLVLLSVLAVVGACSSVPFMSSDSTESGANEAESADLDTQVQSGGEAPAIVLDGPDENPYLTNATNAPRAAQQLFGQAINAIASEQWQEAELLLQQLTVEYPKLSGPFLNLGIVYHQTNQMEQAEQAFKDAIAANSLNLEAYNQLAYLKREQGDFKAAEENYLSALKVWPKHATSHKNIGILYDLYMGQWDQALDHFKKYEYLAGENDKLIAGWIIDLQRRINATR